MLHAVFLARQATALLHVDVYISIKYNPCHKINYKVDPAVPCSRKPRSPPPPPLPRFSVECFRNRRQCHSTQDVQGMPECRLPGPHPSHRQACLLPMPPTYSRPTHIAEDIKRPKDARVAGVSWAQPSNLYLCPVTGQVCGGSHSYAWPCTSG